MQCPSCSADNPSGFRFCGSCGSKLAEAPSADGARSGEQGSSTMFFGHMQQPNRARLVLIKGEGLDGVAYHLNAMEHVAGRGDGDISFPDDPLLSPRHACFYYEDNALHVRDNGSLNGVYIRITQPEPVSSGTSFLVGEQLLVFEPVPEERSPEPDPDGTLFYGSPQRTGYFRLRQLLRGGDVGMVFRAPAEKVTMGREGNDINFPDDPFISGQHAMVGIGPDGYTLTDLGSKNGTFLRLRQPQVLGHGDYVFLGQQLFRVEVS